MICILLLMGTVAIYALSFVYKNTTRIWGAERSSALLGLMFVASFVSCTSSVLFTPYMRNYREIYLVSYLVGEGLSGFLPSAVALIQGVGGNPECRNSTEPGKGLQTFYPDPRFSSEVFFLFTGTLLLLSFVSFVCMNKLNTAKGERVKPSDGTKDQPTNVDAPPSYKISLNWSMSKQTYCYLLVALTLLCLFENGVLPSIQPFSCLPYGNVAYHLTITLSTIAKPIAMSAGFFFTNIKTRMLFGYMGLLVATTAVIFYVALQSPTPPLQHSWIGELAVVSLWILVTGLIGFIKMAIITIFRSDPGKGLYYTGVATQVGSLVGAVSSFALVSWTKMFRAYEPCAGAM